MMQFITILSLLAAAASVQALPGTPIQERQATPTVYARYYPDGGCHGDWIDDIVFAESQTGCIDVPTTWTPFASTNFTGSTTTKTLRLYALEDCNESGNYFDLKPRTDTCVAQQIGSAKFL